MKLNLNFFRVRFRKYIEQALNCSIEKGFVKYLIKLSVLTILLMGQSHSELTATQTVDRWEMCSVSYLPREIAESTCDWQPLTGDYLYQRKNGDFFLMRLWFPKEVTEKTSLSIRIKSSFKAFYKGKEIFSIGNFLNPELNPWGSHRVVFQISDANPEEPLYFAVTSQSVFAGKLGRSKLAPLNENIDNEYVRDLEKGLKVSLYILLSLTMIILMIINRNAKILIFPVVFGLIEAVHLGGIIGSAFNKTPKGFDWGWIFHFVDQWHRFAYLLPVLGYLLVHIKRQKIKYSTPLFLYVFSIVLLTFGSWGVQVFFQNQYDMHRWLQIGSCLLYPIFVLFFIVNRLYRSTELAFFGFVTLYTLSCFSLGFKYIQYGISAWVDIAFYLIFVAIAIRKVFIELKRIRYLEMAEQNYSNRYQDLYKSTQMIIHDIVRPVNLAINITKFLEECQNSEQIQKFSSKFMPKLLAACQESMDIADDFALLGKKTILTFERVNIHSLVQECIGELALAGNFQSNSCKLHLKGHELSVSLDYAKIKRVIKNLIMNADRHRVAGSLIMIQIETHQNKISLSVGNKGSFISALEIDKIFDPFYSSSGSLGLGLHICKKIIALHNGKIWCESDPSEGTTFHLGIPKVTHQNL